MYPRNTAAISTRQTLVSIIATVFLNHAGGVSSVDVVRERCEVFDSLYDLTARRNAPMLIDDERARRNLLMLFMFSATPRPRIATG